MTPTDAGALVALIDTGQMQNAPCRAAFAVLRLPLVTTWPAFAEAMYLLYRNGGWPYQRGLWRLVEEETLTLAELAPERVRRMRELMEKYRDRPMDLADASLVVAAEALGERRIFTIDSDFYIYQWGDKRPFDVVP